MYRVVLFFILCLPLVGFSQNAIIDSLLQRNQIINDDTEKINNWNKISDLYKTQDPNQTQHYAQKALLLAEKLNFDKGKAIAYMNLGNASVVLGDYVSALEFFTNAKNIYEDLNLISEDFDNGLARAYGSIGVVFSEQGSYTKSLEYHLKALKIYEATNRDDMLAKVYNNTGIVYKARGENFKALNYFQKAKEIQEKLNDGTIGITTTNIGNIYLDLNDYEQAFLYYDEAKSYFNKYPNYRGEGELYNNLGVYYNRTNNPDKALESWAEATDKFNQIDDKFGLSDTYYYLGNFHFENNNYNEALLYTQKANVLAEDVGILTMKVLSEKLLSDIYEKQNNVEKALLHYKEYATSKDSLTNYENIRKSVQSEMTFEFEKRESLHKKEQEKKEILLKEQAKRHTLQLFFGLLTIILIVGIGFLYYNRNQLKKTLTLQKDLADYEQKALHLQMNPHFVFNCLGSISSFIVQNGNDAAVKYLAKFSKLMRLTLDYSKETLISVDKEIEGLQNYLELEQLRFNNAFDFSITKADNIEDDIALPPLLIQPFVENAIIHGLIPKKEGNLKVMIDFSLTENNLICTITDNGIGINVSKKRKKNSVQVHKSLAIEIIKKRLEMMDNAKQKTFFSIEEQEKDGITSGTKVLLELPIQYLKT